MLIDFHTHIFPDKIAAAAVRGLSETGGIPPHSDGTRAGLLAAMRRAGVTHAVNLPVLTSPAQFDSVLRFAAAQNALGEEEGATLVSFAGAHPALPDPRAAMRRVREAGIRGIKIHPEYQDTYIDDDAYYALLSAAKDEGLAVVTHAGWDDAYRHRDPRATPERAARLLDRLGGYPEMVLAHFGGHDMYPEVARHIYGREVYIDTAYVLSRLLREDLLLAIERHGDERILFATDSPWQDIPRELAHIRAMALPGESEARILFGNAARLLGL